MGFRARKPIRIAPGVRVTVSPRGIGASVGVGGARYSTHSFGRRTVSTRSGVPSVTLQRSVGGRRPASTPPIAVPAASTKPGLFAPKGEKQLYKAINAQDIDAIRQVGDEHAGLRVASWSLAGLKLLNDGPLEAARLLSDVFATGVDPAKDEFISKYHSTRLALPIAPGVTADLPVNRDAVGLALAEVTQDAGDINGAIAIVEQLEPTSYAAVSLAELYTQAQRWADVVDLTNGIQNEDEACALLLCYRGIALREQSLHDAAHEAFKEALRKRTQPTEIRHLALSERATNYLAQGKRSLARKDLERIIADDAGSDGIRARLAALAAS